MNKIHKRRMYYIALFSIGFALATSFILYALKKNINAFISPSQIITAHLTPGYTFRLGGLVKKGSMKRDKEGLGVEFVVTDFKKDLTVRYVGILPDLFREGKGMVAEGSLNAQ